jgi:hypothetical protein
MALPPNYLFVNPKDGRLVSQSYIQVPGGSAAEPSFTFIPSPDSGLTCNSSGNVGVVANGNQNLIVGSNYVTLGVPVAYPLGTAGAPSITFTGNETTGIYSPGSNQLAISTNGTARLYIASDGKVGVGTSSPGYSLHFGGDTVGATNGQIALGSIANTPSARIDGYRASGTFAGELHLYTTSSGGTQTRAVTIDSSQRVGVGTTSPGQALEVAGSGVFTGGVAGEGAIIGRDGGTGGATYGCQTGDILLTATNIRFTTNSSERLRINSSGRLLVGTSIARDKFFNTSNQQTLLQVERVGLSGTQSYQAASFITNSADGFGAYVTLGASRGTTVNSYTVLQSGDVVGKVAFQGADGTELVSAAEITAFVDGTPGANDMPGRLVFSTTAATAANPTERMRITNDGVRAYNQAAPAAVDTTATLTVANLKTGIITSSTAAAVTMTLPTGTDTEAGFSGIYTNMTFEWSVINTGATNAVTVQGGTAHTLVGSGTIAAGVSGRFASRRTAANTFVSYRLS